jgi:hypothetical protein
MRKPTDRLLDEFSFGAQFPDNRGKIHFERISRASGYLMKVVDRHNERDEWQIEKATGRAGGTSYSSLMGF